MNLPDAVENLYRVFASYPLRTDIPACSCCTTAEEITGLTSAPLRKLGEEQLDHFAFKATTTWGDLEDYKHFLPRILELAGEPGKSFELGFEMWIIAGKLKDNGWTGWPAPEREALGTWFMALWEDILSRYRPGWDGHDDIDFLEHATGAIDDLSPFLDAWAARSDLPALLLLADFIVNRLGDAMRAKGGWQKISQREAIVRWFIDPARGEALDAGIERHIDEPQAETLATGLDFWRSMTGRTGG